MNDKFKQLYSYLRDNNLTDLDENTFYNKYSDPNKSKEIYSYLKQNNMTDLDASSFHSSYFGTSKKKEQSVSPSKPKKEKSSLDIFDKMAEQPSASSVSQKKTKPVEPQKEKLYTANNKNYKLDTSSGVPVWKEYSSTVFKNGKQVEEYDKEITDPGRVNSLNKMFKQSASTLKEENVFTGFPGKESNEYRVRDGVWQRKQKGQKDWTNLYSKSSVTALNNQFKQNVKYDAARDKFSGVTEDVEIIKKKYLDNNLSTVNSTLISKSKIDVSKELKRKFPDFSFRPTGGFSNQISVTAPNGEKKEISLSNWTDEDNNAQARELREFIRINSSEKLANASESSVIAEKENEKEAGINVNMRRAKPGEKEYIPGVADSMQPFVSDVKLVSNEEKFKLQETERKARAEYAKATSELVADIYHNQKAAIKTKGKSDDKDVIAQLAALPKSDDVIKRGKEYANDVKNSFKIYDKKAKELKGYSDEVNRKLETGEITEEEFKNTYKPEIEKMSSELNDMSSSLKSDLSILTNVDRSINESVANQFLIDEAKGSVVGGLVYKFAKGLTYLPRLISTDMDAKEQENLVRSIVGGGTTKEYMESEDRSDITKVLFSLSESMGALASGAAFGGGAATYAAFYGQSYYEMKDELDQIEGMSDAEKVLMSGAYGAVSSVLEKFGIDFVTQKTGLGKSLTNGIMKSVFSDLPKNASKEFIEAAIINSTKKLLLQSGIKITGAGIVEGGTEGLQALTQLGIKKADLGIAYSEAKEKGFFDGKSGWELLGDVAYESYLGALGGGIMNVASSAPKVIGIGINKALNKEQIDMLFATAKNDDLPEALLTNLKSSILTGKMSKEEAKNIYESYNDLKSKIQTLPEELSNEDKSVALDLIIERDNLNKRKEGKDESLIKPITDRITEINNTLTKISENAVQKQAAGEVSVQPEAAVSGEVAQGKSEAEFKKPTQEEIAAKEKELDAIWSEKNKLQDKLESQGLTEEEIRSNKDFRAIMDRYYTLSSETFKLKDSLESEPQVTAEEVITVDKPVISQNTTAEVERVKSIALETEDGATFNLDGTKYEGTGLVVPVVSENTTAEELTPEMIADFVERNQDKIGDNETVKVGIYKFPNSNKISIDLNVVAPEQAREQAIEFGKRADQESLFDLGTFENVKTGGTGQNPMAFSGEQFKEIAKAFEEGRVPNVFEEVVTPEMEEEQIGILMAGTDAEIDQKASTISNKTLSKSVAKAAKAISKILPKVKFIVHDNDESYRKATGEEGRSQSSIGEYNPKTKTIHINGTKANRRTIAHEVFHAVLLDRVTSDKEAAAVTRRMIQAISGKLEADSELKKYLDDFASNYKENIQNEEKLAELVGKLSENYQTQPQAIKDIIKRWINKIAQMFGISPVTSETEVMEVLDTIARKVATGKKIKERQVAKVLGESQSINSMNKRFQSDFSDSVSKLTFVFDKNGSQFKKLEDDGFITRDKSLSNFNGKYIFLHQPDAAFSGMIFKDGEILVEGKGGVFYPIKFHEDGYFWASTDRTAKKMADDLNKVMEQNGGTIYMALTSAPSDKLMSSTTMSNAVLDFFSSKAFDKNFKVTPSQLKSALRKAANDVKTINNKRVGLDLKLPATATVEDIQSAIKIALGAENSSFADRKNFAMELTRIMASEINKNEVAVNQFGKLFSEGIQNKYFKGITKTGKVKISAANMTQALSEMFTEPMLKEGIDRDKGGQVYAILELTGPVKAVKSDKHESYPMAIESANKDNKVTLHLLNDRQNWYDTFEDFETGDVVSKERQLKVFPTSGVSVQGLKVNTSKVTEETSKRKQLSPDNSSNYANLTDDGKGNFVFFHRGGNNYEVIKRSSGATTATSREEARAIGRVGGLAMYYTRPNDSETMVIGPSTYAVSIPYNKVYDFNTDPENIIEEARERFNQEYPGQAFDSNTQLAYVTKIASEKGYDMTVAEWDGRTRAQTILELEPKDVQITDGNRVVKSFNNTYESNTDKGWLPVIPKEKQKMFNDLYNDIYKDRMSKEKYDSLYFLQEESVKYNQDKITEMIMDSDLSDDIKNRYQEILSTDVGKRKSERKQLSEILTRNQKRSAESIVSIARQNGFSDDGIITYLKKEGFSDAEISSAMSINNNIDIDEIFDRSNKAIREKKEKNTFIKAIRFIWNKFADRQSDIKRLISGIKTAPSAKAYNLLVTRAGAKGFANYRYKEAESKIYKGLKKSSIDILDKVIYIRRMIAVNENRAARGMNPYKGIDGFSEAEARRDLDRIKGQIGEKKFNDIMGRADEYFNVFSESLKNLYESGRISEETYNNLKDIEYSPIATIKYIIGDNLSLDEIDRQAEVYGMTRKDIATLTDRNENEIIMDSKWLLMMNLMSIEGRAWENRMLNSFADAIESANNDQKKALSEFVYIPKSDEKTPAGFVTVKYFKDGKEKRMFVKADYAVQLLDIKNRQSGLEALGKMTGVQILKFFATGGNPLFIVSNTAVDFANITFFSNVYSKNKFLGTPRLALDFVVNFIRKISNTKKYKSLEKEFLQHGGGMDFMSSDGLRVLKNLRPGYAVTSMAQSILVKYGNAMSYLGETSEFGFRISVYSKTKDNLIKKYKKENDGKSPEGEDLENIMFEAARESRQTVDFSQGGSWAKSIDTVMPYLNASLQGFRRPIEYAKNDPVGFSSSMVQASIMSASLAGMSIASLMTAFGDEDDEEKKKKAIDALNSISEYEKANYHIIFTGKKNKEGEYQYRRIKKLPVLSMVSTLTEQILYKYLLSTKERPYAFDNATMNMAIEKSIPFTPSDIMSRNPLVSGILTYHFNEDTFTGEEVFRQPKNKKIDPTAEGIYDDKVDAFYKKIAPAFGLSPIRTKAFFEKIITSENTNPTIAIFNSAMSGMFDKNTTFGKEFSGAIDKVFESAGKKLTRYTNKDIIMYKEMDDAEKKEMEIETDVYKKEQEMYNKIKSIYKDGKTLTNEEVINMVRDRFEPRDVKKYVGKYVTYIRNMNVDKSILDILYEDTPEVQALKLYNKYGSTLNSEEREEIINVIRTSNKRISPKAIDIYKKKYSKGPN